MEKNISPNTTQSHMMINNLNKTCKIKIIQKILILKNKNKTCVCKNLS